MNLYVKYFRFLSFSLLILFLSAGIAAQAQENKILRWAADAEGNAPYIIPDPRNPTEYIGFEVDIANAIAKELGMRAEFVQNQWDGLIPGLQNNNYDIAINGIEITEDRKRVINFSSPYYLTFEQLVVMKERTDIHSLSDLVGKTAGALKSSLAERILKAKGGIDVLTYDGEVSALTDMANGRLDAVLVDAPIATYYGEPDPRFKLTGQPIGEIEYGIAVRKEDEKLLNRINAAISKLSSTGKLRKILEEWNLWNYTMALYLHDQSPSNIPHTKYQYYLNSVSSPESFADYIQRYILSLPQFGKAAVLTLLISILSMVVAIILGLLLALAKIYGPFIVSKAAILFIELIRGTPLLIQLYFIYYGLPKIGIGMPPLVAAIIGLGINYAAYEAENYRAGIFSVPRGQMEAALSLGMTRKMALRHVILPQAVRLVIPPMTNDFISLLKDSSLVSIITIVELTKVYFQLSSTYFDFVGTGVIVAIIYLLLGLPFVKLSKYVERKFSIVKTKQSEGKVII
jgi:polar amino acid transport system substrate-binding protein